MKTTQKFWIVSIVTLIGFTATAQDRRIPVDQIPSQIKTYLTTHFQENKVVKASFDDHILYKKYEISLQNNVSLEFSPEHKITEIKSKSKLPDSVIPAEILEYVKANYPKNVITDWALDDGNQQIELDNGLDIEFTTSGKFIKVDY